MPTTDLRRHRMFWRTRKAHHWLALEVKREDCWIGVFWRRTGRIFDTLHVWVCLLPCLPIHYTREAHDADAPF